MLKQFADYHLIIALTIKWRIVIARAIARGNPLKISAHIWIASCLPMTSRVLVIAGLTRNLP
jgi:hypothetical protein